ncbi:hypothetical protein ACFS5L_18010 [Streptomyces phyllanthi]|uniref:Cation/H+ exchanger domain-containing protein n=1 Tax=Streptomyces phyllanthi TaxID=1803180 RepID=A0A5N8WD23_9ACTN|nr:hypothetical protein [Streptomyces phyllanthi]MPY44284.1 hypothetical protein [Streptomyces phyllanthi]
MNTRGLTELIILNVGLSMGVLDDRLYAAMVVMALVTTFLAGPLLQRLCPPAAAPAAVPHPAVKVKQQSRRASSPANGPARPVPR